MSREKYGNEIPVRPPGFPLSVDDADTRGTAVKLLAALNVFGSGVSLQSFCVIAPITTELRMVIELLPNSCDVAKRQRLIVSYYKIDFSVVLKIFTWWTKNEGKDTDTAVSYFARVDDDVMLSVDV